MRGLEQIPWLYDAIFWLFDRVGLNRWRRWIMGNANGRTLEIGCGTGRNFALRTTATQLVGLDPTRDVLSRAQQRARGVPLVRASVHALPFRAGAFDTAVSSLVFCSVPDPALGLDEIKRVLAPGGVLLMIEHVRATHPKAARIQDAMQPLWTRLTGGCHPNRDTEATLLRHGFRIDPTERRSRGVFRRLLARPGGAT